MASDSKIRVPEKSLWIVRHIAAATALAGTGLYFPGRAKARGVRIAFNKTSPGRNSRLFPRRREGRKIPTLPYPRRPMVSLQFPFHAVVKEEGTRIRAHGGDEKEAPGSVLDGRLCQLIGVSEIDPVKIFPGPGPAPGAAEGAHDVVRADQFPVPVDPVEIDDILFQAGRQVPAGK